MRVVLAAGGTGGHIMPALAVAESLQVKEGVEFVVLGTGRPLEHELVENAGHTLLTVSASPILGKGVSGLLRFAVSFPAALIKTIRIFRIYKPDVVIGFGGFPSFVPVFTAWLMRIPRYLQEQNIKVGLANKVASLFANSIFAVHGSNGFWGSSEVHYIDNPVRKALSEIPSWKAPEGCFQVLIIGGSQGAVSLNNAVLEVAKEILASGASIVHQAGAFDAERVRTEYKEQGLSEVEVHEFIDDLPQRYAATHLVIARAGAMSVAEITAAGRPAIYVPLPIAGGHQRHNVERIVELGGAMVLEQDKRLASRLKTLVCKLLQEPSELEQMATKTKLASQANGARSADTIADAAVNGLS